MTVCVTQDQNGYLLATNQTDCTEFVLMNPLEFQQLQDGSLQQVLETLNVLFAFNPEIFAIVELSLIMAFLTSHFSGRVVRWLGK